MKRKISYILLIFILLVINTYRVNAISNLNCEYNWKGENTTIKIAASYTDNAVDTVNVEIFGVDTKVYDKSISSQFTYQLKPNGWWIDMNFHTSNLYNQGKCPSLYIGWTASEKSGTIYLSGNTALGEKEYEALELTVGQSDGQELEKEWSKSYTLINTYRGTTDNFTLGVNTDKTNYYILNQSGKKSLNETITTSLFIYRVVNTNDLIVKNTDDNTITFAEKMYICKEKVEKGYTYLAIVSESGKSAFSDCVSVDPTTPDFKDWEKPAYTCFSLKNKYFDLCENSSALTVFKVVGVLLNILKILVPILLIIFGSISLFSAVASGDDNALKNASSSLAKKIALGVAIFFIPTIINFIFDLINGVDTIKGKFDPCIACLKNSNCDTSGVDEDDEVCEESNK